MVVKENSILHQKNKIILASLFIWVLTIFLFIVALFITSFVPNKDITFNQVINFLVQSDVAIGIIAFIVMVLSLLIRIIGRFIVILVPILILIVVYFVLIFPQTQKNEIKQSISSPITSLLSEELKVGSSGENVILLQSALTTNNLLSKNLVTGYFGTQTKNAVMLFQKDNNILQTGELDKNTLNKFNKIFGDLHSRQYYLSLVPTNRPVIQNAQNNTVSNSGQWGVAEKVAGDDVTYRMRVGQDAQMATGQEIFDALNTYRSKKGVRGLNWDGNLANYAQERANFYASNGLDAHAGMQVYINNIDNRKKLGFLGLGENGGIGYRLNGTHIIEWIFASDAGHEGNQLNSNWTDVGIGVSGTGVDIIFGYDRF